MENKFTCKCCGYKTLGEYLKNGTYEICKICYWEDDGAQNNDPDQAGGANEPSLREAQKNFIEFGCSEKRFLSYVRPPNSTDTKDPDWKPL